MVGSKFDVDAFTLLIAKMDAMTQRLHRLNVNAVNSFASFLLMIDDVSSLANSKYTTLKEPKSKRSDRTVAVHWLTARPCRSARAAGRTEIRVEKR